MSPKQSSADRRLFSQLRSEMDRMTASERVIANFLLTNRQAVPFETANSLAAKLAISAATVGRFCRRLGYRNFRELKAAFKLNSEKPELFVRQLTNPWRRNGFKVQAPVG